MAKEKSHPIMAIVTVLVMWTLAWLAVSNVWRLSQPLPERAPRVTPAPAPAPAPAPFTGFKYN